MPRASNDRVREFDMRFLLKTFLGLALAATTLSAQSIEKAVAKMGENGAKAYFKPLVTGFGANLNAGWSHNPPEAVKYAFHVKAGMATMGASMNGAKTMNVTTRMPFDSSISRVLIDNSSANPAQRDSLIRRLSERNNFVTIQGPTVIGAKETNVSIIFGGLTLATGAPGDSVFIPLDTVSIANVAGLLDGLTSLTLFAPQISLGTVYGTNLTLRWLPEYESREEIGPITVFGIGLQHNPAVWLNKPIPVNVTVGASYQTLEGSFFKATAYATGINVAKTYGYAFASATPFAGVQYENTSVDLEYDLVALNNTRHIKTTITGDNTYRLTAGLNVRLLAINITGDINYAQSPSYSLGFMIGL
jgi:hypothetical protein